MSGGRPATHAVRQSAADLDLVKPRKEGRRLSRSAARTRRAVKRIERRLREAPLATVREDIERSVAAQTVIERRAHDFLLTLLPDTDHPTTEPVPLDVLLGLTKFVHWIGARLDRNRDQLLELLRVERAQAGGTLADYLREREATSAATTPPIDAAAQAVDDGASE